MRGSNNTACGNVSISFRSSFSSGPLSSQKSFFHLGLLGSFEEWCRIVGGIVSFAGVKGFLGNLDDLYRQSDPSLAAWEAFLFELKAHLPSSGFKVADVVASFRNDESFRAVLPEDLGDLDPLPGFQRRLGKAFLKRTNRKYGQDALNLVRLDVRQGSVVWGVRGRTE